MGRTTTIEIQEGWTAAQVLDAMRKQAPHLLAADLPAAPESDVLLTPGEVARLFRVDPKTVTRWGQAGRLSSIKTPGGHRRYRQSEVRALLAGGPEERAA